MALNVRLSWLATMTILFSLVTISLHAEVVRLGLKSETGNGSLSGFYISDSILLSAGHRATPATGTWEIKRGHGYDYSTDIEPLAVPPEQIPFSDISVFVFPLEVKSPTVLPLASSEFENGEEIFIQGIDHRTKRRRTFGPVKIIGPLVREFNNATIRSSFIFYLGPESHKKGYPLEGYSGSPVYSDRGVLGVYAGYFDGTQEEFAKGGFREIPDRENLPRGLYGVATNLHSDLSTELLQKARGLYPERMTNVAVPTKRTPPPDLPPASTAASSSSATVKADSQAPASQPVAKSIAQTPPMTTPRVPVTEGPTGPTPHLKATKPAIDFAKALANTTDQIAEIADDPAPPGRFNTPPKKTTKKHPKTKPRAKVDISKAQEEVAEELD